MPPTNQCKEYPLRFAVRDIPKFGIPPRKIMDLFFDRSLGIPIFKKGKDCNYLRAPEYNKTIKLSEEDHFRLLWRISSILIDSYKDIQIDSPDIIRERIRALSYGLSELLSCREDLIAARIVDQKTFKKTCDRIANWIRNYVFYINKGLSADQRTQVVKNLYNCFKESVPKLRDKGVFYCIAHILKGFGIEEGNIEQIYGRIRVDFYRKR